MIKSANNLKLKIIIFVFIIWGIIHFASYPLSYSKFIVEEDEFLKYNSNIIPLEQKTNGTMNLISSNKTQVILEFSLEKNTNNVLEVENEKYQLILPKGCIADKNEITFRENEIENIRLTCDITEQPLIKEDENNIKYLDVSVKVNEVINDEIPFRYKEYTYYEQYQEPESINEKITESDNRFDVDIFKDILYNTLLTKEEYKDFTAEINSYIESAITSENSFQLLGITVSYQEEYNQYTYREDENFLGYARTYYANKEENDTKIMIFSSKNEVKLEEAFNHYIKSYYQFSKEDIAFIRNYTNSKGTIGKIIANKEAIDGITLIDAYSIKLEEEILEIAKNIVKEKQFEIYNDTPENMKEVLLVAINSLNIPLPLKEKIITRQEIINGITITLNKPNEKQYFLIRSENVGLLVEISYGDVSNQLKVLPLTIEEKEYEISFILEDSKNNMLTDEETNNVMNLLEKEFDSITIKDSLIKQEDSDCLKIIFKMQKNKTDKDNTEQATDKDSTDNDNTDQTDINSNDLKQEAVNNTANQDNTSQDESLVIENEITADNMSIENESKSEE